MNPTVGVITPLHHEPVSFLERNLDSVQSQRYPGLIKHYIILDGETPEYKFNDYAKIIRAYKGIFLMHQQNKGLPSARNTGIKKALEDGCEYFMLLDTDDTFVPHRVNDQMTFMLENQVDHCYGGYSEIHTTFKKPAEGAQKIIPTEFADVELKKGINPCYCGSNAFSKKVVETIGLFDESMTYGAEDAEYWLRIALSGLKQVCLPKVLYYLGVHGNNMTAKYVANGNFEQAWQYIQQKHHIIF